MKTKRAGLGLLLFGVLLIGSSIFLAYNPIIIEWVGLREYIIRYAGLGVLSLHEALIVALYNIFTTYYPSLAGMISLVLGVGVILL